VKRQIGLQWKTWSPVRQNEANVDGPETPVQYGDETCQRGGTDREHVFQSVESGGKSEVGKETDEEGGTGEEKTNDSEILKMPAICLISDTMSVDVVT